VAFPFKQVVEEVEQQWLREFLPEDTLEANVCKRIDKLSHIPIQMNLSNFWQR